MARVAGLFEPSALPAYPVASPLLAARAAALART